VRQENFGHLGSVELCCDLQWGVSAEQAVWRDAKPQQEIDRQHVALCNSQVHSLEAVLALVS
jgi:hypothetical protein